VEIVSNKIAWLFRMSSAVGFFKAVLMNFWDLGNLDAEFEI
jgi:hypothetical protein